MKEHPSRKTNRLKDYDYNQEGAYFITICVKDRLEILGEIVGDAPQGVPSVKLTKTGEIVKLHIEHINGTPKAASPTSKNVHIDNYVIMPNHIHLIISIENGTPSLKDTSKGTSPTKAAIPQIVNTLKSLTSKKYGKSIWQRSYYDHIIRNESEYGKIWEYIDVNPLNWETDEYYI